MSHTPPHNPDPFMEMRAGQTPSPEPGYLAYWEMRGRGNEEDARVADIVSGLTQVALRGLDIERPALFTDREPALQARYWYRSLGPLNPLEDAQPDMVTAAELMYQKETRNPQESANLRLDSAYIFADLAYLAEDVPTQKQALSLGLGVVGGIKGQADFEAQEGSYRLQTHILEGDLRHAALRLRYTGSTVPALLPTEAYRQFEEAFVKEERHEIAAFGKLIKNGITDENFGILFEWYLLLARRHQAWADEELDTVMVRGATSRENAEWTGEHSPDINRLTANHDIVITTAKGDDTRRVERLQLKTVKSDKRRYHPSIKVIDFEEAIKTRFTSIDGATDQLVRNLRKFLDDYQTT